MVQTSATILCVDDEDIILKSLKRLLFSAGYKVFLATSGAQGLQLIEQEDIDLIIADQRMPVMTGSEFLKQVHQEYPDIVSIMLSGYTDFDSLVSAVNDGRICRFVAKPWDNEMLLGVVAEALKIKRSQTDV